MSGPYTLHSGAAGLRALARTLHYPRCPRCGWPALVFAANGRWCSRCAGPEPVQPIVKKPRLWRVK